MANLHMKNWLKKTLVTCLVTLSASKSVFATTVGDLPFDAPMTTLKDAISGPWLLAASIIMVVITCVLLAFGDWGDGFKKIINIVLWLSIAFGATSFINTMFGGGAVF